MKKVTLVLLAVLFLATLALAGDETPKTKEGDKAMLFSFSGLNTLGAGSYMGGIGGKYYFQDDMALRLGLGFSYGGQTLSGTNGAPDQKDHTLGFGIHPALTYNLATAGPVVAYVGGQVDFAISSRTTENITAEKVVTTTTSFGVGGLAGFEWFPWSNISLSAEYGLSFGFGSGSVETTNSGTSVKVDAPDTMNLGLGSSGALTLGVWF